MNKNKLIELRCKAWGITEDEYYCNQCSDFSLEDMARAYRRGKNKGRADLEKENAELKEKLKKKFDEWIKENGGISGVLYQTFSDDELEHIFMSAYEKNNR